ncbi:unnamed protein product [Urochloa decumbens]|uniref:Uncharacterized protein n=1 Tax=Urochloa decumbens TaxID=240449 RepID=A0ABC8VCT5_9POAL
MKSQMDGVGSEETVSDHGPVLEEFMPLKPSLSLSSEEHESAAHDAEDAAETPPGGQSPPIEAKKVMPDWLQSVQLWGQEPQQQPSSPRKEVLCKPVALNARKTGGAFRPFEKEKRTEIPPSSTTAAASSAVVGDSCDKAAADMAEEHSDKEMNKHGKDKGKDSKDKEGQSQAPNRKPRRCWAPELHRRFLQALQQLGGSHGCGDAEADPGAHEGRRSHQRRGQKPSAEVSSAHEAAELGHRPEHQRRAACSTVRRGGRHLGAATGVRCRCSRRCCSGGTATGAANWRRLWNQQHGLCSGSDVAIWNATALAVAARPEAIEQVLGCPA